MRSHILSILLLSGCVLFVANNGTAQTNAPSVQPAASIINSSPAFAEILLRKTELQAEVESLLSEYTEDYPKVKETQYQLAQLQKGMDRVLAVKSADSSKLTLALGKLIVRKCELETEVWALLNQYKEDHPDVKRAKRKVDVFEQAIKQILG
jgi:uncharacterized protein involved in exopolysaccharide biosynthesis